ncbi:MAG: MEDS domain-containing protein, partial [Anaerolineaceae bacterium]|nr:MEDS domain-containing protein [Anaerolineaceae bacterium]
MENSSYNWQVGEHVGWFYENEQDHARILNAFITNGLQQNQRCIYLGNSENGSELLTALKDSLPGLQEYSLRGQITVLAQQSLLNQGKLQLEAVLQAIHKQETLTYLD